MKPPRVFINDSGYFSLEWYESGNPHSRKKSLKIAADLPFEVGNPTWWHKSKHQAKIKARIKEVTLAREYADLGIPTIATNDYSSKGPVLLSLLEEYNDANADEKDERSPRTIEHRLCAVKFAMRFLGNIPITEYTRSHALTLRREAKKAGSKPKSKDAYKPKSLKNYFSTLSSIFAYAVEEKYIRTNPFAKISIKVIPNEPRRIPFETELASFTFIYQSKPDLFFQLMFERLTGFRVSEICNYLKERVYEDTLTYWNQKAQRFEIMPQSYAIRLLIDLIPKREDKYLFKYRNRRTVSYYCQRASEMSGVEHMPTHQLKKNYGQEIDEYCSDERLFDALMHHAPKSNIIAVRHYSGRNIRRMLETLNLAQQRWIPFLQSLKTLSDLQHKYHYGNKKRKKTPSEHPGYKKAA